MSKEKEENNAPSIERRDALQGHTYDVVKNTIASLTDNPDNQLDLLRHCCLIDEVIEKWRLYGADVGFNSVHIQFIVHGLRKLSSALKVFGGAHGKDGSMRYYPPGPKLQCVKPFARVFMFHGFKVAIKYSELKENRLGHYRHMSITKADPDANVDVDYTVKESTRK